MVRDGGFLFPVACYQGAAGTCAEVLDGLDVVLNWTLALVVTPLILCPAMLTGVSRRGRLRKKQRCVNIALDLPSQVVADQVARVAELADALDSGSSE